MIAPARRDRGLLRDQRGEVLIAGLRRRQKVHEGGETEGGNVRPLRSVTRRNHTQLTLRLRGTETQEIDDGADLLKIELIGGGRRLTLLRH